MWQGRCAVRAKHVQYKGTGVCRHGVVSFLFVCMHATDIKYHHSAGSMHGMYSRHVCIRHSSIFMPCVHIVVRLCIVRGKEACRHGRQKVYVYTYTCMHGRRYRQEARAGK